MNAALRWLLWSLFAVTLGYSVLVAVDTAKDMSRRDACYLDMGFDFDSARTVDTSWFPPSVLCEYEGGAEGTVRQRESRWRLYAPVPIVGACVVLIRRGRAGRSSEGAPRRK